MLREQNVAVVLRDSILSEYYIEAHRKKYISVATMLIIEYFEIISRLKSQNTTPQLRLDVVSRLVWGFLRHSHYLG